MSPGTVRTQTRRHGRAKRSTSSCACGLVALALLGCGTTSRSKPGGSGAPDGGGEPGVATGGANASGGGGSSGTSTPAGGSGAAAIINLNGAPAYYRFVRLTNSQWAKSVQQVLNLAEPSELAATFVAPVRGLTAFENNELMLDVTQRGWADFQSAAEALAEQVTASDAALRAVYPDTDSAGFIQRVGRRAFRRPLSAEEQDDYGAIFATGAAMSGSKSEFAKGAALVIRALLQSPHFLYRSELGPTGQALDGYEAAAKLSLWLRDASPDEALLDHAEALTNAEALVETATAMLGQDEARQVMRQFHGEMLHFDRFAQLSKVGVPSYDPALNAEYEESSYLFFDDIFGRGGGVRDIFTSTRGFMGPGMATLYGLPSQASGFVAKELGAQRVGYFSQLPFLTLHGSNAQPETLHRGVSLALDVLCAVLGPSSPNIPPPPERRPGETNRQRIEELTAGCGGSCHAEIINPLGFAFEHFDGMGQYRDTETSDGQELPIDSSGAYGLGGKKVEFADHTELMSALATSQEAHLCYAKQLASFALQRDIVASDLPLLSELSGVSRASDGSIQKIMLDLIRSDSFRTHVGGAP